MTDKYKNIFLKIVTIVFVLIIFGCASYYQRNIKFQELFIQGKIEDAEKELKKNKRAPKDKNRLLYFLQNGVVLNMLGRYEESNQFFEEAYIYYKAVNYLLLNKLEEAQVECRRINIILNQLNDKYGKYKNRYKRDAFALNLMGIIFEAAGDVNSAFISYRNAFEAYQEDYVLLFGVEAPLQLKRDLLRTAYLNGFTDELERYEKLFKMNYSHQKQEGGELIFFWNNGLGPVKDEWSINFFIVRGSGGMVTFVNEEMGLSFPFSLKGSETSQNFSDLKFVRVAFPKYLERKPYFKNAELIVTDKKYPLELAQNINEIAFRTLEDKMMREMAMSLLRLAVKQASEQALRSKNENLGALLSIANILSEKADTRNWQTLPYSISYARIPLPEGSNTVQLKSYSPEKSRESSETFQFEIKRGQTLFFMFHNLENIPLGQ